MRFATAMGLALVWGAVMLTGVALETSDLSSRMRAIGALIGRVCVAAMLIGMFIGGIALLVKG